MFTEPLTGTRYVHVREHRTTVDWAQEISDLRERRYPEAEGCAWCVIISIRMGLAPSMKPILLRRRVRW
jgi:hypothetical protein